GAFVVSKQLVFSFEPLPAPERLPKFDLRAKDAQQPRVVPGFLDEIASASPHSFYRNINAAPCSHNDYRKRAVELLNASEKVQPFLPASRISRVVEVHQ